MRSPSAPVRTPCEDSEKQVEEAPQRPTAFPLSPALPLSLPPRHAMFPVAQKIALGLLLRGEACLVRRQVGMAVAVVGVEGR